MKSALFYFILFSLASELNARIAPAWSYREMFEKADLVVIARVTATKDTSERSTILDLNVVGVATDFKTHLVLKGDKTVQTFQLHHYRLASESDKSTVANGPQLIQFSWEHPPFLLFLIKEESGKYAPVTGQDDPGGLSVLELKGGAD